MADREIDYSIVIPVYFNEGCLVPTTEAVLREVVETNPQYRCEIIFVDDGSGDGSLEELLRIREQHPTMVKVIKLLRNFGQVSALLAGFSRAAGKCVVAMSADGQDPAELINEMLRAHFEEGNEVVICSRKGRDESRYRIWTSRVFYTVMKKLTFPDMPDGGFDFVLLGRRALDTFLQNVDQTPFFQGQILWMGYKTKKISYHRRKRTAGTSRWTFGKKLTYLIDGVLGYSFLPIRLMSVMGILLAFLGFLYALTVFLTKVFLGNPVKGWTPLMIVVLVMGGVQMLMLGVIGEYLWRTLSQVRNRDLYIIDEVYDTEQTERE